MRVLKLRRRGENLLLCLDEQPQIDATLEVALGRKVGTLADLAMSAPALGGLLKNNDFLHLPCLSALHARIAGHSPASTWPERPLF